MAAKAAIPGVWHDMRRPKFFAATPVPEVARDGTRTETQGIYRFYSMSLIYINII